MINIIKIMMMNTIIKTRKDSIVTKKRVIIVLEVHLTHPILVETYFLK
jgi:hypothetical protein